PGERVVPALPGRHAVGQHRGNQCVDRAVARPQSVVGTNRKCRRRRAAPATAVGRRVQSDRHPIHQSGPAGRHAQAAGDFRHLQCVQRPAGARREHALQRRNGRRLAASDEYSGRPPAEARRAAQFLTNRRPSFVSGPQSVPLMTKAAFGVGKGTQNVLTLSEAEVARHLDPAELLRELEASFGALARGEVQCPPRPEITVPGKGFSLAMSAWQPGMQICVKVVNVFEGNLARGLPNHLAILNLFDAETGAVTCVMDATYITGIRTAAAAVLSHKLLSRPESRVASIVGAGVQAREHLRLLPLVRDLDEIQVCSLEFEHSERLARLHPKAHAVRDARTAIERSDIVCLATHSAAAVIEPGWVRRGTHVSSVGYYPPDGELPRALVREHRVFVETMDAFAPPPVGCSELSGVDAAQGTTLGDAVNDRGKGRVSDSEITIYKAMGIAMEDMVAANLAYEA